MAVEKQPVITKDFLTCSLDKHVGNLEREIEIRKSSGSDRDTHIINDILGQVRILTRSIRRTIDRIPARGVTHKAQQGWLCKNVERIVDDELRSIEKSGSHRRKFITALIKVVRAELAVAQQEIIDGFSLPEEVLLQQTNTEQPQRIEVFLATNSINKERLNSAIVFYLWQKVRDELPEFLATIREETPFGAKITLDQKMAIIRFLNNLYDQWFRAITAGIDQSVNIHDLRGVIKQTLEATPNSRGYPGLPEWFFEHCTLWFLSILIEVTEVSLIDICTKETLYRHAIANGAVDDELRPPQSRKSMPFFPEEILEIANHIRTCTTLNRADRELLAQNLNNHFHGGINVRDAAGLRVYIQAITDDVLNLIIYPPTIQEKEMLKVLIEDKKNDDMEYDACMIFFASSAADPLIEEWTVDVNENYYEKTSTRTPKALRKLLLEEIISDVYTASEEDEDDEEENDAIFGAEIDGLVQQLRSMLDETTTTQGALLKIVRGFLTFFETYYRTANTQQLRVFMQIVRPLLERKHLRLSARTGRNSLELDIEPTQLADILMQATAHLAIETSTATRDLIPIISFLDDFASEITVQEERYRLLCVEDPLGKFDRLTEEENLLKRNICRLDEAISQLSDEVQRIATVLPSLSVLSPEYAAALEQIREKRELLLVHSQSKETQSARIDTLRAEITEWTDKSEQLINLETEIQVMKRRRQSVFDAVLQAFRTATASV